MKKTMKTEGEIRNEILKTEQVMAHVINIPPATIEVNAPRALMQLGAKTRLEALYWVLGEKRPKAPYDDFKRVNC